MYELGNKMNSQSVMLHGGVWCGQAWHCGVWHGVARRGKVYNI